MKILALSFFLCLCGTYPLFPADLTFSAKTEIRPSTVVPLAEQAEAQITVKSNQEIKISSITDPYIPEIYITKTEIGKFAKQDGEYFATLRVTFVPLNSGEISFPSLSVPYTFAGQSGVLQTPPAPLSVMNPVAQAAAEQLKDIKPPLELNTPIRLILMLIAILAGILYWYFKKQKKEIAGTIPEAPDPSIPADELALQRLEEIWQEYQKTADDRKYYIDLSNLFREFLSQKYGMDALEKTTSEIFQEMRRKNLERKLCLQAREILSQSDLVKFARFVPGPNEIERDYQLTKQFIEETRKKPAASPEREEDIHAVR